MNVPADTGGEHGQSSPWKSQVFGAVPDAGQNTGVMTKNNHEIRDPIHVFVRLDSDERKVVDSRPFQRLHHIHQLGMSYLVYPGATHKRFEHSLGVMELASRVFDVVTNPKAVTHGIRELLPEITDHEKLGYWRRVIRMAALCHDLGHLPFSHAAEQDLLPEGWNHERLTAEIIRSDEMREIWEGMTPPLRPDDIVKLAVGDKKLSKFEEVQFSDWETILAEIIVGDAFGVDRIDYLLRDSHHTGVAYGKFDHYRLIDTLRILTPPASPSRSINQSIEPTLGVEEGGLHSAEALLLARYFMFSQVYFHRVRRIYDIHLKEFLTEWLLDRGGEFPTVIEELLPITDNEVTSALREADFNSDRPGHKSARRISRRKHFKVLYKPTPDDVMKNPDAVEKAYEEAKNKFGEENVRLDHYKEKDPALDFPVLMRDGRVVSALSVSQVLGNLPIAGAKYVFIERELLTEAKEWFQDNLDQIIEPGEQRRGREPALKGPMKRLQRAAIILELMDQMKSEGSWCGQTHIQKAMYFLQELVNVPTNLDFILYKHGPFASDLQDEFAAMRADRLLRLQAQPVPYGPTLVSTDLGEKLKERFPKTLARYAENIRFIAERLSDKGVADLERLGTALLITRKLGEEKSAEERAREINRLKPHVSIEEAREAVQTVDKMLRESSEMFQQRPETMISSVAP